MPYLILVSLIWGFSFVIIKGSLAALDSNFVSFVRLLLSLALFLPFIRPAGPRPHDQLNLMLIGAVQFGLMYVAYIAAYRDLPAHIIALLTTTTPIFVSIAHGFYAKKFYAHSLFLALLAVAGGVILEFPDQPLEATLRGVVLVQASNAAFAFGQIAYKNWMEVRPGLQDKNVFVYLYGGAVAVAGIFSLVTTDYRHLTIQSHQWLALLYLGIIASGLGFFLFNAGARRVDSPMLAIFNNVKIPLSVAVAILVFREEASVISLAGGTVLMVAALWLQARAESAPPGTPGTG